jgi:hypothetical protein
VQQLKVSWYPGRSKAVKKSVVIEPAEMLAVGPALVFKNRDGEALLVIPSDWFIDAVQVDLTPVENGSPAV